MNTALPWLRRLARPTVDLWLGSTDGADGPFTAEEEGLLDAAELTRMARFRHEADRRRFLYSRVLLRTALSDAVRGQVDPKAWRFEIAPGGKPIVARERRLPRVEFSLSHAGDAVVAAVCHATPVGVDVEPISIVDHFANTRPDVMTLAHVALTPAERNRLQALPANEQAADFTRLWTLKEAYAKLLGRGVSLDFTSFEAEAIHDARPSAARVHMETRPIRLANGLYQLSLATSHSSAKGPKVTLKVFRESLFGTGEVVQDASDGMDHSNAVEIPSRFCSGVAT